MWGCSPKKKKKPTGYQRGAGLHFPCCKLVSRETFTDAPSHQSGVSLCWFPKYTLRSFQEPSPAQSRNPVLLMMRFGEHIQLLSLNLNQFFLSVHWSSYVLKTFRWGLQKMNIALGRLGSRKRCVDLGWGAETPSVLFPSSVSDLGQIGLPAVFPHLSGQEQALVSLGSGHMIRRHPKTGNRMRHQVSIGENSQVRFHLTTSCQDKLQAE